MGSDVDFLAECFDVIGGELYWKKRRPSRHFKTESADVRWHARFAGKKAGSSSKNEYGNTPTYVAVRDYSTNKIITKNADTIAKLLAGKVSVKDVNTSRPLQTRVKISALNFNTVFELMHKSLNNTCSAGV